MAHNCQFLLPEVPRGQPVVEGPDRRYSSPDDGRDRGEEDEEEAGIPWTAVCAGIFLVLVILIGCSVLVVYVRVRVQERRGHHGDSVHSDSRETMNNLTTTNNFQRGDKEPPAMATAASVKNTNKKVDYHSELAGSMSGLSGVSGSEKSGFKTRYPSLEYNLVHELRPEELPLCKEEEQEGPEAKGDCVHEPEMEERRRKRLNRYGVH